jgi:hypothetical protein
MTDHTIHPTIPSGFTLANDTQALQYLQTGLVDGATKVVFVQTTEDDGPRLAVRLGPPRYWYDVISPTARYFADRHPKIAGAPGSIVVEWYRTEYEKGWRTGKQNLALIQIGASSKFLPETVDEAFRDGYFDAFLERPTWHRTYCPEHEEGCGV